MRKELVRFTLLQLFLYAFMGAFTPYMIAMGLDRGFSQTSVSIAVSFQMICVLLSNVFWGRLADWLQSSKKIFILTIAMCGVIQILLYFSRGFGSFFCIYGLFGFMNGAVGVLLDSWLLRTISYDIAVFRKIRSAGSLGYAATIAISGRLVESVGYGSAALLSGVLVAVTIALCFGTGEVRMPETAKKDCGGKGMDFLKSPVYVTWLILLLLIGIATSPVGNMKIVILERVGAGASELGIDGLIGCAAQFVMFFLVSRLEKYSPVIRMMFICLCVMLGLALYIAAGNVVMVYAASMLFYAIFSIINPSTREIVRDHVPLQHQTAATGIADAFSNNVSTMVAMLYSGAVSDRYGINMLLTVCMYFALLTMLICFGLLIRNSGMRAGRRGRRLRRPYGQAKI